MNNVTKALAVVLLLPLSVGAGAETDAEQRAREMRMLETKLEAEAKAPKGVRSSYTGADLSQSEEGLLVKSLLDTNIKEFSGLRSIYLGPNHLLESDEHFLSTGYATLSGGRGQINYWYDNKDFPSTCPEINNDSGVYKNRIKLEIYTEPGSQGTLVDGEEYLGASSCTIALKLLIMQVHSKDSGFGGCQLLHIAPSKDKQYLDYEVWCWSEFAWRYMKYPEKSKTFR